MKSIKHIIKVFGAFSVLIILSSGVNLEKNNSEKDVKVEMITSKGKMILILYPKTILHRKNFIELVKSNFYEGILFHRVINGFMAQAGDPKSRNSDIKDEIGQASEGSTIPAEFINEYYHKKGALAAARMGDDVNPQKASSGSQFYLVQGQVYSINQLQQIEAKINTQKEKELFRVFFQDPKNINYLNKLKHCQNLKDQDSINILINKIRPTVIKDQQLFKYSKTAIEDYTTIGGTPFLDGSYTVFGEIVEGMEIIDELCKAQTGTEDRPIEDVKIISIRLIND